ncbi:MAG: hypothetical protein ACLQFR_30410 [Streptosporangiaceae bacterium]
MASLPVRSSRQGHAEMARVVAVRRRRDEDAQVAARLPDTVAAPL